MDESKPSHTEFASFRVYRQADGRFKAVGSVERSDGTRKTMTSSEHTHQGQALGELLQFTGFLEP